MVRKRDDFGMRNVVYALSEEKIYLGNEHRISYGIVACSCAEANGTATIVASVHDITASRENLSELVDDCNRLGLSVMHLADVVEDFLSK